MSGLAVGIPSHWATRIFDMSKQIERLKIGLLENGVHSLRRGYEIWGQWNSSRDAWLLKESIIFVHHGIELLLKQLLVQKDALLIFQDKSRAEERLKILRTKKGMQNASPLDLFEHDDSIMSLGFKNLVKLTADELSIAELSANSVLRRRIDQLTKYRNKIVHFAIEADAFLVSNLISEILDPLLWLLSARVSDPNFKDKEIRRIIELADPVRKYIEYFRGAVVYSAITATKKAFPPLGDGRAGVVAQATGSGLSASLLSYLKAVRNSCDFLKYPIIILVDSVSLAQQAEYFLSKDSDISFLVAREKSDLSTKNVDVLISSVQMANSEESIDASQQLIIGYALHGISHKLLSSFFGATYILFTSAPSRRALEYFGPIIEQYDLSQAIADSVSTPIRLERISLDSEAASTNLNQEYLIKDFMDFETSEAYFRSLSMKIMDHFESYQNSKFGKAIVIVSSVKKANILFHHISKIFRDRNPKPDSIDFACAISSVDTEINKYMSLRKFADEGDSLRLLIGSANIFLGFDCPVLNTIYVTCPVSPLQKNRISSLVSRCHKDKAHGTIVDFVGQDWP